MFRVLFLAKQNLKVVYLNQSTISIFVCFWNLFLNQSWYSSERILKFTDPYNFAYLLDVYMYFK